MRFVRGMGGALLWVVACVVGLLGAVLSVTVILLPVGVPLLLLARKLFGTATKLLLPRAVSHPVQETRRSARKTGRKAKRKARDVAPEDPVNRSRKRVKKATRRTRKRLRR